MGAEGYCGRLGPIAAKVCQRSGLSNGNSFPRSGVGARYASPAARILPSLRTCVPRIPPGPRAAKF